MPPRGIAPADGSVTAVTALDGRRAIVIPAATAAIPRKTATALVVLATDDPHRPSYWPRRKYRKVQAIWRVAPTRWQIADSAAANRLASPSRGRARGVAGNPNPQPSFAQHCALESVSGS